MSAAAQSARPLFLKGLPASRVFKQYANLNNIANYKNSSYKFPTVNKLELIFKKMNAYGHMGARQFWKFNLRTINFHNPKLAIDVQRIECATKDEQLKCPSVLRVHFANGKVQTIECKNKHSDDIMSELVTLGKGVKVAEEEIPVLNMENHEQRIAKKK